MPSRSIRRSCTGLLLVAAPWSAIADGPVEEKRRQQQAALIGVIGHWLPVDDGGPAFKVDAGKWSGQTASGHLETMRRSLFPNQAAHASFITNGAAPGAFPLAVWSPAADFTRGTLRVQFKLIGGASDQTAGIVFGLQPTGEYYFVRYNTKDGNVAVWQYAGGERTLVHHGTTKAQLPLNTWHELVVTVVGTKVTGAISGSALTVEHTLDKPVTGRVGLWTKRDAITSFKGYRVTS